jgi:pyruvate,orthophosphate dikinase
MAETRWIIRLDGTAIPEKTRIGGKAWSIGRMQAMGLPVPPAFVITTEACRGFLATGALPPGLSEEIDAGIAWLEGETQRQFGGLSRPLLVSVRSGAAISMPGMMDTVLNLGMSDATEEALARESGLPRFARDTHRRFLELYSSIVLKTRIEPLEPDVEPTILRERIRRTGAVLPDSTREQLFAAVQAVFESWNTRRARRYRDHNNIPHDLGTAVTIQAMVFGNLDERSGTGVIFSRNPLTGERIPYGEYLPRAQGEDVVSGRFTPLPLSALRDQEPNAYDGLIDATARLEREQRDVQDIEFTLQCGRLYLLQARSAKRAPQAAVRAAVDMVAEGMIDVDTALTRVSSEQVRSVLLPRLRVGSADSAAVIARGEGACPGVASGVLVADPDEAESRAAAGETVILLRVTTSPEDLHGMIAARAVVTEQGGSTSHAAVVSRALGRPCVVGVGKNPSLRAGSAVTVDGSAGVIYAGELPVEAPAEAQDERLNQLIGWARARTPVAVLRPGEPGDDSSGVDVDCALATTPPDSVGAALRGITVARGSVLSDPAMARLAVEHGVLKIVTEPILPVLLGLIRKDVPA